MFRRRIWRSDWSNRKFFAAFYSSPPLHRIFTNKQLTTYFKFRRLDCCARRAKILRFGNFAPLRPPPESGRNTRRKISFGRDHTSDTRRIRPRCGKSRRQELKACPSFGAGSRQAPFAASCKEKEKTCQKIPKTFSINEQLYFFW